MDRTARDEESRSADSRRHGSPEGKVIGAFDSSAVNELRSALTAAGFPADQIDVVTADDIDDMDTPLDRPGLRGLVGRFLLSMGDDLDELERARQELAAGYVLVGVAAHGSDAVHRVGDIMRDHGARTVTHFGRWTITDLD